MEPIRVGQTPVWGAIPMDESIKSVRPLDGWVMLREQFLDREVTLTTGLVLQIARPYVSNTVYGQVVALSEQTAAELAVSVGDIVVYREYAGARWSFKGDVVLLTASKDILAIRSEEEPAFSE